MGVLSTAYLTGKATLRASEVLKNDATYEQGNSNFKHDWKDATKLVWKLYIPPALSCVTTISSIILAQRIGHRRAAALASAYTVSERAFAEYKEKIVEKLGEKKEQDARDEIAQEKVLQTPGSNLVVINDRDQLCFEAYTGRYFTSSVEKIRTAVNDINAQIIHANYASLDDFYTQLGLDSTDDSSEVGWNTDMLMKVDYSAVLSKENTPCISISYAVTPIRDYY